MAAASSQQQSGDEDPQAAAQAPPSMGASRSGGEGTVADTEAAEISTPEQPLRTAQSPEGVPIRIADPRPEEFAPGLDPELLELVQATAEIELAEADEPVRYGATS